MQSCKTLVCLIAQLWNFDPAHGLLRPTRCWHPIESVAFCAKANFSDEHTIKYSASSLGRHTFPEIGILVLVRETGINQRNYCQGGRCHVLETLRNQWFTPAKAFWFSFQTNHRGFLTLGESL